MSLSFSCNIMVNMKQKIRQVPLAKIGNAILNVNIAMTFWRCLITQWCTQHYDNNDDDGFAGKIKQKR